MKLQKDKVLFLILLLAFPGCKDFYAPPAVQTNVGLLVVDGFLNNGADSSFIRLTRTKRLQDGTRNAAEPGAQVFVEDAAGNPVYYLNELSDGVYATGGISLNPEARYKLRIHTASGKQYLSDELIVKSNPVIDSINWDRVEDGIMIYANTHDLQKNTLYYRWDYTETWEYSSPYFSQLKYEDHRIQNRTTAELIHTCWTTQQSTSLLLGSSARLSEDIIYKFPLRLIESNGIELSVKYSILVRQYSLTKDAFDYLQNLKKITEQMGSLFDAQPSQLTGNIHSLDDANEPVLGYMTATTMQSKRVWIKRADVEPWKYRLYCAPLIAVPEDSLEFYFGSGQSIPIDQFFLGRAVTTNGAEPICADCTMRGGITIKPDFWP